MTSQRGDESLSGASGRGLITAMAMWFLMHSGFFLLIPLLSVHFVDGLGWAAAYIGMVLAARQLMQQGLTMFGGALADRFGPKRLILLGVLIRAASFAIMGYATERPVMLLAAVLAALGGALFDAPMRAAIAVMAPPESLNDAYAKIAILLNLARTVGPLIGAALIQTDFRLVGLAASGFFLAALVLALFGLPDIRVSTENESSRGGIRFALSDRAFVTYTALMMGFWYMWVQISIALPLRAKALSGSDSSVGLLFAVNAVIAIILQVPALRLAQRYLLPMPMLILGLLFMALGLGSVTWVHSSIQLYMCIFFFALGTVLAMPNSQTVAATMAHPAARGAYFGVNSLALALGGSIGQIAGGTLVDVATSSSWQALPWLVSAAVGTSAAIGLMRFYQGHRASVTPKALLTSSGD